MTDANNNTWNWTYDTRNRVTRRCDAIPQCDNYKYDANSNLTQRTKYNSFSDNFTYDALNRKTFEGWAWGAKQNPTGYESKVNYTWDSGNRLIQAVDSISGTVTRTYDGLDRLLTDSQNTAGIVSYTYDAAGNRLTMTAASDPQVTYTYDHDNMLKTVSNNLGTVTIHYDADERRSEVDLPNGVAEAYTHDAASRMTAIGYTKGINNLGNLAYAYDSANRRIETTGSFAGIALPGSTATLMVSTGTMTYNTNNSPKAFKPANPQNFGGINKFGITNDVEGSLTVEGTNSPGFPYAQFVWSARGNPNNIWNFADKETPQYDPFGRRTNLLAQLSSKGIYTNTTYLYDRSNVVQEQISGVGTAHVLYGLGMDERYVRTNAAGVVSYFLTDAMGSTVALTDSNGVVQTTYVYGPFGATNASGAANDNPYRFIGRELEPIGGLYNMRARFLDTGMGRFVTRDPQGLSSTNGFLAMYSYANNNPLAGMDPTGHFCFSGGFPVGPGISAGWADVDAAFGICPGGAPGGSGSSGGGDGGTAGAAGAGASGTAPSSSAPPSQQPAFVTVPCGRPVVGLEDAIAGLAGAAAGVAAEAAAPEVPGIGVVVGIGTGIAVGQAFYGVGCTAQIAGPVPSAVAAAVATPAAFGGAAFISAGPALPAAGIGGVPFP